MTKNGTKNDVGKVRYDLFPPQAVEQVAKVLTFGAGKYGDRNWENGLAFGRVFSATMRHLWAWWRRRNVDPETGINHLAHAACNCLFLLHYTTRSQRAKYARFDDRPRRNASVNQAVKQTRNTAKKRQTRVIRPLRCLIW